MKKKKKRRTKADLFAEMLKHNKLFHCYGRRKHKCKDFEEVIIELKDNDIYNAVRCSECNFLIGLIRKDGKEKK